MDEYIQTPHRRQQNPEDLTEIAYQGARYSLVSARDHKTSKAGIPCRARLYRAAHIEPAGGHSGRDSGRDFAQVASSPAPLVVDFKPKKDGVIAPVGPHGANDTTSEGGPVGGWAAPLTVSFDAEWYESMPLDPGARPSRIILSIQLGFRGLDGRLYVWILEYPRRFAAAFRVADVTALRWFLEDTHVLTGFHYYRHLAKAVAEGEGKGKGKSKGKKKDLPPHFFMTIVGHYGIVDWTTFFRGKAVLREMDSVRRTLTTVEKPLFRRIRATNGNGSRTLVINVRDTMHLAPSGSSLAALGDALSQPKITLPDGFDKSQMGALLSKRPDVFMVYSATDAVITLLWIEQMAQAVNTQIPVTLGGQAADILRKTICAARGWSTVDFDEKFRGLIRVTESDELDQRKRVPMPKDEGASTIHAAAQAYYGGRNEAFLFGIHHATEAWYDFDLSGAYPTAMSLIPDLDFDKHPVAITGTITKGMIHPFMALFGLVRFRFPVDTLYPCLPIKDMHGRGLVYPIEGQTWASAPEIWLALEIGAYVEFVQPGLLHPTKPLYSLGDGVKVLVEARALAKATFGKGSPQELAAKERANSAYGKLAQGLAGKRGYSTRHDASRAIPPSKVTSAPHATMTTALVRAVVSAAMVQLGRMGYRIASVTTDGFLTDAPQEVVKSLDLFGLRDPFVKARHWLANEDEIWELKHAARSLVMLKTRGGFGVGEIDGHKLPAAGAGYKVSGGAVKARVADIGKAEALAELFLTRPGKVGFQFHALPSPRDYVRKGADGIGTNVDKSVSWEWDYKRRPGDDAHTAQVEIDGRVYEHVSYSTVPWRTMTEFDNARAATDGSGLAVKTIRGHEAVMRRIERRPEAVKAGVRARGGVARSEAVSVLRGLRNGTLVAEWYTPGETKARVVLERVAEVFGVGLGPDDWKNAGRPGRSNRVVLTGLDAQLAELGITVQTDAA